MLKLKSILRNFKSNHNGIAAVEFALILPILSLLTFGGYATFEALQVNRSVERTSAVISDLISRMAEIDDDTAENLEGIAASFVGELSEDNSYQITMSNIQNEFDTDETYELTVDWSFSNKPDKKLTNDQISNYDIPNIPEGETIILVYVTLEYSPWLFQDDIGKFTLEQASLRRPRFVPLVMRK